MNYSKTKITWIEEVPSSWKIVPLFFVATDNKRKNKNNNENVLSLSYGKIIKRDLSKNFGLLPNNFDSYQEVDKGYIIIRSTDLQNDKKSLRVGLVKENGVITSAYIGLSLKENINSEYLFYYLNMCDLKKVFYSLGGGLRQSLRFEEFKRFPVILPSLNEQKLISEYLDRKTKKIDLLIEKIKKKIKLLDEQKTALINQYVIKGLNPFVEMKDSGMDWVGDIPKHWKLGKFKHIISCLTDYTANGSFKSLAENVKYLDEGYSRLIRLTDLRKNFINTGVFISQKSHEFLRKSELFGNEILIANVGSVGVAIKMPLDQGKCSLAPNMYLVRNQIANSDLEYVLFLLNSNIIQNQLKLVITSTAQPKINKDNLKSLRILMPPLEEQKQIGNYLLEKNKQIDLLIHKEKERKSLIIEYRQSLISSVVTGKIRITEDMI